MSSDTTKIDLIQSKIKLDNLRKFNLSANEDLIIADISTLGIEFEELSSHIVFLFTEDTIVNSFIVSLSVKNSIINKDVLTLHALQLDETTDAFSAKISIFNLEMELLQFNNYVNGQKIETGVTTKKEYIDDGGRIQQTCVDWYLVTTNFYSDGSTETTTVYLFTTCSEEFSLAGRTKRIKCGGGGGSNNNDPIFEQTSQNRICGSYGFLKVGDGYTGEVLGLGVTAHHSSTNRVVEVTWPSMCITFGSALSNSVMASEKLVEAWNAATNDFQAWLNASTRNPTDFEIARYLLSRFKFYLGLFSGGYTAVTTSSCVGQIPKTQANFNC